jgi:hypothetical protein
MVNGKVNCKAGAVTRPGNCWADTTCTVIPDAFKSAFKV